ncbi:uncharacterized protein LOC133037111 [Cannabis sativa]|uniref:uncharacterized protein LOC133037111 n=1 Tax=Cannabis sativa TaxID=3483 RepID=UPI0029CA6875|nr:uncharacterized protein LOC133037111 [Cannabis sativa]
MLNFHPHTLAKTYLPSVKGRVNRLCITDNSKHFRSHSRLIPTLSNLLIIPWCQSPHVEISKGLFPKAPIQAGIQLKGLDIKYWVETSLFKIVSQIGDPLQVDNITKNRERLQYPRILVQVSLSQEFPSSISFTDEFNHDIDLEVKYEWIPLVCYHSAGIGHETNHCRTKEIVEEKGKQVWVPKQKQSKEKEGIDEDGFQKVTKGKKVVVEEEVAPTEVRNMFDSLTEQNYIGGGEIPLPPMDRLLCWNVRGINSQHKYQEIKQLIQSKQVGLVSLLETKVQNKNMGKVYASLFSGWCFSNNNSWLDKGRIIMAWQPNVYTVDIRFCSSQIMHYFVQFKQYPGHFQLTLIYGFNDEKKREQMWIDLEELGKNNKEAWLVMGDFNEILNASERVGKRAENNLSQRFRDCTEQCGLSDMKFSGNFFTCNNKQKPDDRVFSKIDRALVNSDWVESFADLEV